MRRKLLSLLIGSLGTVGLVLSGGCGAGMFESGSDVLLQQEDFNTNGQAKTSVFQLVDTKHLAENPDLTPEIHEVYASTSYDPIAGDGYANLSGQTIVVEYLNGSMSVWSDYDTGQPRFSVNIYLEGSFVPSDGTWTKAMEALVDLLLSTGGSHSVTSWSEIPPVPGCEGDVVYNTLTGEYCPWRWQGTPNLDLWWDGSALFSETENCKDNEEPCPLQLWSYANFSVNVNGGTITGARSWMQEKIWTGQTGPDGWRPWTGGATFEGVITGNYEGGQTGGGGGKG